VRWLETTVAETVPETVDAVSLRLDVPDWPGPSPSEWSGRRGRVDSDLLSDSGWPPTHEPRCYVCGPTAFVEAVANDLVAIGHEAANVRTERFGPTGGG
jgi:ferredoxin-NADP reductase